VKTEFKYNGKEVNAIHPEGLLPLLPEVTGKNYAKLSKI
jgi:hypothetical protein